MRLQSGVQYQFVEGEEARASSFCSTALRLGGMLELPALEEKQAFLP